MNQRGGYLHQEGVGGDNGDWLPRSVSHDGPSETHQITQREREREIPRKLRKRGR